MGQNFKKLLFLGLGVGSFATIPAFAAFDFKGRCNPWPTFCGAPAYFGTPGEAKRFIGHAVDSDGKVYHIEAKQCGTKPNFSSTYTFVNKDGVPLTGSSIPAKCAGVLAAFKKKATNNTVAQTNAQKDGTTGKPGADGVIANGVVTDAGNNNTNNNNSNSVTGNNSVPGQSNDFNQKLADLESKNAQYTVTNNTTYNGEDVTLKAVDGKGVIGVYNSGSHAGEWFNPRTGSTVHSDVEYTANGKLYHGVDEARAAGLDRLSGEKVTITKYDDKGNVVSGFPKTMRQIEDGAKTTASQGHKDQKSFDDCQMSYEYAYKNGLPNADKFKCNQTQTVAKAADIANQVMTTAGRNVVNTMGAQAAMNAQNGTFSAGQDGAAKMAKTSFTYETGLTTANAVAAAVLARKANQHKQNLAALNNERATAESADQMNDESGGLRTSSRDAAQLKLSIEQQTGARNIAAAQAIKSTFVALQSATAATNAKNAQKAAEKNANLARQAQEMIRQNSVGYDANGLAPPNGTVVGYNPDGAAGETGSTQSNNSTSTSTDGIDPNAPTGPMLGIGNDLGGGDDSLKAPVAGQFKAGGATGGGGGGGGGAMGGGGGGGGGGGPSGQEESKAAYASEFGTKERYESGGGAPGGAKGGAKGGDGGGIDLNGLLAQFLPKGEEDLGSKNGILDSVAFGGNRNVANEEAPSYLDKNADLFQRIHETMSEKNRKGQLGI